MVAEKGAQDDPRSLEYLNLVQVPENRQSARSGQSRPSSFYVEFASMEIKGLADLI
jgi:hypothetical protein